MTAAGHDLKRCRRRAVDDVATELRGRGLIGIPDARQDRCGKLPQSRSEILGDREGVDLGRQGGTWRGGEPRHHVGDIPRKSLGEERAGHASEPDRSEV